MPQAELLVERRRPRKKGLEPDWWVLVEIVYKEVGWRICPQRRVLKMKFPTKAGAETAAKLLLAITP